VAPNADDHLIMTINPRSLILI